MCSSWSSTGGNSLKLHVTWQDANECSSFDLLQQCRSKSSAAQLMRSEEGENKMWAADQTWGSAVMRHPAHAIPGVLAIKQVYTIVHDEFVYPFCMYTADSSLNDLI